MDKNTLSVHRCHYPGCANCFALFYGVRQHIFECRYREHCVEREGTVVLEDGERSALAKSHDWFSSEDGGEVAGTANELKGGESLELAVEGERTVPDVCLRFAEFAVRLTRKGRRLEIQKLMNVVLDGFFDAKGPCRHVIKAEDCECLVAERVHGASSSEGVWKAKLRTADETPNAGAVLYKKTECSTGAVAISRI